MNSKPLRHEPDVRRRVNTSPTAEICPTQSESRLPVPVHVTSHNGRLATDTVMSNNSQTRSNSKVKPNHPVAHYHTDADLAPLRTIPIFELRSVQKPVPRNQEYDSYEERLRSYHDWPMSSALTPEELARAGFYYTHYSDKTKCPYCMGAIYNWEETDTAFGEHMRHYPHCDFLKYVVYISLTTPAASISVSRPQQTSVVEDSTAVKAVLNIGYPVSVIRDALTDMRRLKKPLCSENILDTIYDIEKKVGHCLVEDVQDEPDVNSLTGAVGGLNLNEQNSSDVTHSLQSPPSDDDLYHPSENFRHTALNNSDSVRENTEQTRCQSTNQSSESNINSHNAISPEERLAQNIQSNVGGDDSSEIVKEYRRLQKSNICNKCRQNSVNILFLPCRHLVACERCAENIDECLECDEEIIGTVKVFLT